MKLLKPFALITSGGLMYGLVEIAWRGVTHISMFIVGGLCFYMISLINEYDPTGLILIEAPICAVGVTVAELCSGLIINRVLLLGVWDYSELPLNLWGQICLPFSVLWLGISFPAILVARAIRRTVLMENPAPVRLIPNLRGRSAEAVR